MEYAAAFRSAASRRRITTGTEAYAQADATPSYHNHTVVYVNKPAPESEMHAVVIQSLQQADAMQTRAQQVC